jgi:hypothetical protein
MSMNGNCKLLEIFEVRGGLLSQKWLNDTQDTAWPRYSYDKPVYQISFQYVQPVQRKWTETANHWNFSKSKGHNSVKNGSIVPKTKLDLNNDNSVYQISFQYVQPVQRKWTETANYWNFSKSKGHNSVKNGSIVPKTELGLDILIINLYIKFHLNMCNHCIENERKLMMDRQTNRPTDSGKTMCPPFFEGGIKITSRSLQV